MKKAYVVFRGCYSDMEAIGVFSTEEKAKDVVCVYGGDCRYEMFDVDATEYERNDTRNYFATIINDVVSGVELFELSRIYINTVKKEEDYGCLVRQKIYSMHVKAKDTEHARKIVSEKMQKIKALKDTHYPLLDTECVKTPFGHLDYPRYNIDTFEIILEDSEELIK